MNPSLSLAWIPAILLMLGACAQLTYTMRRSWRWEVSSIICFWIMLGNLIVALIVICTHAMHGAS